MALTQIDDRGLKTPIDLLDNEKIRLGTGNDLELYHDGTQSQITESGTGLLYINSNATVIRNSAGNENQITAEANGSVGLYYNNSKKFETTSSGVTLTGDVFFDNATNAGNDITWDMSDNLLEFTDDTGVSFGDGKDLQIYHNGSNSHITNATGHVELNSSWRWADNARVRCGASSDLEIYHDGSNSYLVNTTGALHIRNDGIYFKNADGSENFIDCSPNAEVSLFYNNSKKLETTSTGAAVYDYLQIGSNDDDPATLELKYSTVPSYLTSTYDGTVGETTLSANVPRTSDGSASWGSHANTSWGSAAIQVLSHSSSGGYVTVLTSSADNTNPTEKLRVTGDGDVIIGSGGSWSYPKALNVQGSSGSILSLYNADTTSYAADTNSSIEFKLLTGNTGNQTGTCEIRAFKENGTNGNNARGLSFYTGGNGGSNAERLRIQSGGGISFNGDTAAANALDDYEEGSWTPTLTQTAGVTLTTYGADYTKIGRMVHAYAYVYWSGTPSSPGTNFQIGGLPFTAKSGSTYGNNTILYMDTFDFTGMAPIVMQGNNYVYFHVNAGSSSQANNGHMQPNSSTRYMLFAVSYMT